TNSSASAASTGLPGPRRPMIPLELMGGQRGIRDETPHARRPGGTAPERLGHLRPADACLYVPVSVRDAGGVAAPGAARPGDGAVPDPGTRRPVWRVRR